LAVERLSTVSYIPTNSSNSSDPVNPVNPVQKALAVSVVDFIINHQLSTINQNSRSRSTNPLTPQRIKSENGTKKEPSKQASKSLMLQPHLPACRAMHAAKKGQASS